ncbi:hypothetical protein [Thiolapillus sp.]|uniref:hypothetical protein n=1 Tax=Thiolapillus sp. TaxID=2017437 RepID=UPI0025F3D301|nr:hypothetical protein [Thiolapillus sp.]
MTRTAGARIGCQRPSLGCPKIYHEVEDTLDAGFSVPALPVGQLRGGGEEGAG